MATFSPPTGSHINTGDEFDNELEDGAGFDDEFETHGQFEGDEDQAHTASAMPSGNYENAASQQQQQFATASPAAGGNDIVSLLKEQNMLLSHMVSMASQSDSHKRSLKAMAAGSKNVTVTANVKLLGTLEEFAAKPEKACIVIPAGTFLHKSGTLLDVSVADGNNSFPVSWLMHTKGISNLAPPSVGSPAGELGVCYFEAKKQKMDSTSIISSNESEAVREFNESYPGINSENLMTGIKDNDIMVNGKKVIKYMTPKDHPISDLILTKMSKLGRKPEEFYSELSQKYHFDEQDVMLAANEIKKKLTSESNAISFANISFPLTRGFLSETAKADKSALAPGKKMLDTYEIPAHIKSGNVAAELTKVHSISAKLIITYAPSPNSERN